MLNRRHFLGVAAASVLPAALDAQTPAPPRPVGELARHALTGPFEGFEVVLVQLNSPPGGANSGPGHRHPGAVLGYVLEGQLRFAINNEPVKVVPAGSTFFEPSGVVHTRADRRCPTRPRVSWHSCWSPREARSRLPPDRRARPPRGVTTRWQRYFCASLWPPASCPPSQTGWGSGVRTAHRAWWAGAT